MILWNCQYTFSFCYCMICFMLLFALLFSMNALASRLKYNLFEQSILFLVPFMIPSCRKLHPFCMLIRFGIQIYEIVIVVYEIHELCLPMVLQCTDLKVRLEKWLFSLNDLKQVHCLLEHHDYSYRKVQLENKWKGKLSLILL